jgi:hypothetical protein
MLEPIRINPSLRNLSGFIGHWDAELVFPADPPGKLSGIVVFDWLDNGAFLVMRSETEGDGPPKALAVIGCDDSSGAYSMLYYDARGVSRIYAMTYADGAWSLDASRDSSSSGSEVASTRIAATFGEVGRSRKTASSGNTTSRLRIASAVDRTHRLSGSAALESSTACLPAARAC